MSDETILALDSGTQSVRAILFDLSGRPVDREQVPLVPYSSPRPGWAEQDPDYYWASLGEACRPLVSRAGTSRMRIAALALTTQRSTTICLDAKGIPLRPAIVWLDQRRTEGIPPVGGLWGLGFALTGAKETIAYLQAEAECSWLASHEPETWRRTAKFLFLSGFLNYRLTGRLADSSASQVGYVPFDYRHHRWASRFDWKWRALAVRREQLPDLVPPGATLGTLTAAAARHTGLPEGLPVLAAAADKACEALGAGCIAPDLACLSYGTTATINTVFPRYVEPIPMIPPYPAATPGAYSVEVQIYRGYWMVRWALEQFGLREEMQAKERGLAAEELFDEAIRDVPPGSMGLVLQPYWSPGLKLPGPEAKGAVIGFGEVHTRAHLYRALLEGIAFGLREGKERTERRGGTKIREVRVAGGGSRSDEAMQITADVFGLPAARPEVSDASGLGAAIDAAAGLGLHSSFEAAVRAMTRVGRVFAPRPEVEALYDRLYRRVYRQMYRRLRPLYEEIRDITGFPPR